MAFDGNGNWIPEFSAKEDRDAGVKILASRFDDVFQQDLKESFEKCLTNDAQSRPLSDFNFNNHKGINVADPETDSDVVNLRTVQETCLHKTGTETASGVKTFSDGIIAKTPASETDNSTNVPTTEWCTNASKTGNLFGSPNYSGAISWGGSGKKTASSNGILHIYRTGQSCNFVAKINDKIEISIGRNGSHYWDDVSSQFLLKKGDFVNITEFNGIKAYFIPCL